MSIERRSNATSGRPCDRDGAGLWIKCSCLGKDQAGIGQRGQGGEIDMGFVVGVFAPDQAGQHAGVGCFRLAADQGQAHAGFGLHGEPAQNLHMRVAGAQQDDVGFDRAEGCIRLL